MNRAGKFDHDSSREYEICWNVPQPGRGTNFWIPLRLNSEQEELWDDLLDDESSTEVGELRLQKHRKTWTLHVTVEYEVEVTTEMPETTTRVGFDIGESMLVTGCALQHDIPTKPLLINGKEAKRLPDILPRLQSWGSTVIDRAHDGEVPHSSETVGLWAVPVRPPTEIAGSFTATVACISLPRTR